MTLSSDKYHNKPLLPSIISIIHQFIHTYHISRFIGESNIWQIGRKSLLVSLLIGGKLKLLENALTIEFKWRYLNFANQKICQNRQNKITT